MLSQKDDPELVTSGPYHLVRHPIYSGILTNVGSTVAFSWLWLIRATIAGYFVYQRDSRRAQRRRGGFPRDLSGVSALDEDARVRDDPAMLRIDRDDGLLPELHARLVDRSIRVPDLVGLAATEHDVELREPEHERIALSMSVIRTLSGTASDSPDINSRPPNPAPRTTTCSLTKGRVTKRDPRATNVRLTSHDLARNEPVLPLRVCRAAGSSLRSRPTRCRLASAIR